MNYETWRDLHPWAADWESCPGPAQEPVPDRGTVIAGSLEMIAELASMAA